MRCVRIMYALEPRGCHALCTYTLGRRYTKPFLQVEKNPHTINTKRIYCSDDVLSGHTESSLKQVR